MNAYAIVAMVFGGGFIAILAAFAGFYYAGRREGKETEDKQQAQHDLAATKKADAVVATDITNEDLDKNLRNGTF